MIVFTIAWGKAYIDAFINRCLPSLLTPGNLAGMQQQHVELVVFTTEADSIEMSRRLDSVNADHIIGRGARIITGPRDSRALLCAAVRHCLDADDVFMFAVPDLIYADGVVLSCVKLQAITTKIVAIFNGRVMPDAPLDQRPVQKLFFEHMSARWCQNVTSEGVAPRSVEPGHLIYRDEAASFVWCTKPNPCMGRFRPDDLRFFETSKGIGSWDQEWAAKLARENRLLVQTNLDVAMSIEPSMKTRLRKVLVGSDEVFGRDTSMLGHICFTSMIAALPRPENA